MPAKWCYYFVVFITFLSACGTKQATEVEPSRNNSVPSRIQVQTKEGARLLEAPVPDAAVISDLPNQTVLWASEAENQFLLVEYGDQKGWVFAAFLRFDKNGAAFMAAHTPKPRRAGARNRGEATSSRPLQQCAHVHSNGKRCFYQTADPTGNCPEHQ